MPDPLSPEFLDVAVAGGALRVGRFGSGPEVVLGLHGITRALMDLAPLARRLSPERCLVAPDLRGRGASNHLPGPYGLRAHAADCAAVLTQLSVGPVPVVGESMGAYVGVVLAAEHPELVERLVLADGGIPLSEPVEGDPEVVVEAVLGPALERLGRVFPSRQAYLEFWKAHPAFRHEWGADVEAFLDYELEEVDGGFRSRARPEAVRVDGAEHLVDPTLVQRSLEALRCPVWLLRAERNLMDEPPPLLPEELVAPWRRRLTAFHDEVVDGTNHYTLCFGDVGTRRLAEVLALAAGATAS